MMSERGLGVDHSTIGRWVLRYAPEHCRCRPVPYLNNVLEQDHRFVKKRISAGLWFRSVDWAVRTIAGYEAINMIRKGQVRWLPKGDIVGQMHFVEQLFGIAA
jgi:transposase-like protein